ncbi:NAD synthase, ammonia-dependent [Natrialba magadii ATCC 43099]|uniref:NH(3)-dependent NAD(+) synthetase n=2 Tax=Natrialba magadii (strain ATCC 43099 / DSM 3394 / CCM 3739 / CIP 104546 / IAM 13178 / JCM 8861 / NBRC 102185 / NCIMB 2190 / MS3) TaxID=547559 RepID=D3SY64_NATMM|nr:NAD+ synthase [Natrialba magadii]ADD06035.1 NAD synthase, ammonia-dependent [Natrialba magadii ATCC 43099]
MANLHEQTQDHIDPLDLRFDADELEAQVDHLTNFIRDRVDAAGANGAEIALSGGIDSTTMAYLAVEALGADNVHAITLPKAVNEDTNMSDAERVAEELGIEYDVIEIDPIMDEILELADAENQNKSEDRWEGRYVGNTSARVRMTITYLIANRENRIVLGTGNRAELATGYVTKYGDGGVDCNPLGNLYKQQVRQVAAHLGASEDVVQKTPTGGMVDYESDEEELGLGYDTLDAVLALSVDGNLPKSVVARLTDTTVADVSHVETMYEESEHKRTPPAVPDPLF